MPIDQELFNAYRQTTFTAWTPERIAPLIRASLGL